MAGGAEVAGNFMTAPRAALLRRQAMREPATVVVGLGIVAALAIFVLLPIIEVVTYPNPGDYLGLASDRRWLRAAMNTGRMVILSTASATVVGFAYAFALSRLGRRTSTLFRIIALLPLFSPPFTLGFSYLLMFGRYGLVTHGIAGLEVSVLGWGSLWAVQTLTHFPIAALATERVLRAIPGQLEFAARNLGAGGLVVFATVTIPLVRPAIAGSALLVAMYVLADFANPLIIGGGFPLLATEAWYRIEGWGDMQGATLMATTLLPPALGLFLLERFWVSRRRYVVVSGRGSALQHPLLSFAVRAGLVTACGAVATAILLLYFGVVAGGFTQTWGVDWTPTVQQWSTVADKIGHLENSAVFASAAALLATGIGLVAAYLVDQRALPARRAVDLVCVLPAAVPGVFLGIGYLLTFNRPGVPLAGTSAILVLALAFANLPFGYQVIRAGLAQIDSSLAHAAADLGASRLRILWDVHLRLIFPICVAAWSTTFVSCITNLSIVVFLVTAGSQVATYSILGLIGDNRLEAASALTTALLALTLIVVALTWRIARRIGVSAGLADA
jgi:iron(III) transport system permease protein